MSSDFRPCTNPDSEPEHSVGSVRLHQRSFAKREDTIQDKQKLENEDFNVIAPSPRKGENFEMMREPGERRSVQSAHPLTLDVLR